MTYCDTISKVAPVPVDQFVQYSTSRSGLRFHRTLGSFSDSPHPGGVHFTLNLTAKYQRIWGFGGAFTDAAGINIESLSLQAKENLMRSYFSTDGIEFNFGRVPVAGSDFSTHTYTYDDVRGDTNFTQYNLTDEDFFYKIPLIKEAQELSERGLHLVACAWTAPPWMKTNGDYSGFGFLKSEYYQAWADYLVKFLDEYKKQGLEFWGISTGNEPINGIIPVNRFNSMGWTPWSQRQWIKDNFGPTLKKSHYTVKLLALEDQRFMLPWWINVLMSDKQVEEYIDGIAVHWYWDSLFPPSLLDRTHNNFPDKFILATEACVGDKPWEFDKVKLGSWSRGEWYMEDILQDLNHWVTGWLDWNLALNPQGGPSWARNFVDAAIIVNATANEFYKQPMFYAVGHFAKFIPEGSLRIGVEPHEKSGISAVAFQTPENAVVIILYNRSEYDMNVTVTLSDMRVINLIIQLHSFHTVVVGKMKGL
ncbi:lysosomal acid glucosylceramidase isoform X2 [Cryptotermes secundus]|nr:lysosomal acid glucosylceramidase isoform X2 [Cryptotermes secundus]XP_023704818.1 lysosomal acid glucosylceramidase isoform X2 [Cryptotermes secundus]XP_023704819.1 lysosomal acid glucosylceramidase isoform X2 [Cryptotermes secundus]